MNRVRSAIGLNENIQKNYTGSGITVAILDSGIVPHVDFDDRIVAFADFVSGKTIPYDDNGHGTHIAGILGGSGKRSKGKYAGIAPECRFVVGKVLNRRGNGNLADILKGIRWCIQHRAMYGIRIINISVGMMKDAMPEMEEKLNRLVEEAWEQGMVVVCAAGNNGPDPGSVTIPGNVKTVITVGAADEMIFPMPGKNPAVSVRPQEHHSGYSGRGPTKECIVKPEILAPGTEITSCYGHNGYTKKTGTSMAVPVVSGAVALMLQKDPAMTPVEVKLRLYERSVPMENSYGSKTWGKLYIPYLLL